MGWFARREPFYEPELETLTPLDLEPFGLDLVQGAAQVVLSLQRNRDNVGHPLEGADRPGGPGDVIGQQQQPARAAVTPPGFTG